MLPRNFHHLLPVLEALTEITAGYCAGFLLWDLYSFLSHYTAAIILRRPFSLRVRACGHVSVENGRDESY